MNKKIYGEMELLVARYPVLDGIKEQIWSAYLMLEKSYTNGGKLLLAGNGGSAADSEHIVGELMKSFKISRKIGKDLIQKLIEIDVERGKKLADTLEKPLTAIALTCHSSLTTAYLNDVGAYGIFAQQLYGYARNNDVFLAISTSGNSENILNAAVVAKALGLKVIGLTGNSGGKLASLADILVNVPSEETYMIQELHLPIYHCWCMMLEKHFFGE